MEAHRVFSKVGLRGGTNRVGVEEVVFEEAFSARRNFLINAYRAATPNGRKTANVEKFTLAQNLVA